MSNLLLLDTLIPNVMVQDRCHPDNCGFRQLGVAVRHQHADDAEHRKEGSRSMIIVAGTIGLDPADIAAFHLGVRGIAPQVRAEDGCLHYSLLPEDPELGTVNVLEMWRDDAALKVHLAQPWITAFMQNFGAMAKGMDIKIYDVAGVRPLQL